MTLDPTRAALPRRDFNRSLAALGLAAASGGLLSGCTTREAVGPGANAAPNQTGDAGGATEPITLGLIPKSQSNPIFNAAKKGAFDKAAELSKSLGREIKIDWRGPNDEDGQKQAEMIEQLVSGGVQGLAIACSDATKVTRQLDDAIGKGVATMCFDSDAPESKRLCYVGTDDFEAGKQVMQETLKLLGDKKPVVAILAGNQTATNLAKRVAGAKKALEGIDHQLVEVVYNKETPQDAFADVETLQKAHPDINGWAMVGGWPLMTPRPLPWTPGEVICVSMDTMPEQLEHLVIGDVQLLLGQKYYVFGQRTVEILVNKIIENKDPEKLIEFAPLDVVTKENVDEFKQNWKKWS